MDTGLHQTPCLAVGSAHGALGRETHRHAEACSARLDESGSHVGPFRAAALSRAASSGINMAPFLPPDPAGWVTSRATGLFVCPRLSQALLSLVTACLGWHMNASPDSQPSDQPLGHSAVSGHPAPGATSVTHSAQGWGTANGGSRQRPHSDRGGRPGPGSPTPPGQAGVPKCPQCDWRVGLGTFPRGLSLLLLGESPAGSRMITPVPSLETRSPYTALSTQRACSRVHRTAVPPHRPYSDSSCCARKPAQQRWGPVTWGCALLPSPCVPWA